MRLGFRTNHAILSRQRRSRASLAIMLAILSMSRVRPTSLRG
jgi:hypothetical protein